MTEEVATSRPGAGPLACIAAEAEPLKRRVIVRHDPSYVTQLIANAADLPNMPQRRRGDRAGPLAAYAAVPIAKGQTRRMA